MQGPLLSALDSKDNSWCLVGPAGRHKHWQPANGSAASVNNKVEFLLASLPGPAIASIFHHLDIYSSHQLALTCQACAREAAHHRTHYKSDYCAKILPKVHSIAKRSSWGLSPYGTITCAWTGSSSDALPYIHTMSQQPEFLTSMWKAAWSTVPHSFYADLRSMTGGAMDVEFDGGSRGDRLTINLLIHSSTRLHVSWAWLQAFCETAKATLIEKFFHAVAGYVDSVMDITCWVYRPQGQLQMDEWESESMGSPQGGPWKFVCQHPGPDRDHYSSYLAVASHQYPEQNIAVTGSWCEFEG